MRDRIVFNQRRAVDAVDAGAAVADLVVSDDVVANRRRRAEDRDPAAAERVRVPTSEREPAQDRVPCLSQLETDDRTDAMAIDDRDITPLLARDRDVFAKEIDRLEIRAWRNENGITGNCGVDGLLNVRVVRRHADRCRFAFVG